MFGGGRWCGERGQHEVQRKGQWHVESRSVSEVDPKVDRLELRRPSREGTRTAGKTVEGERRVAEQDSSVAGNGEAVGCGLCEEMVMLWSTSSVCEGVWGDVDWRGGRVGRGEEDGVCRWARSRCARKSSGRRRPRGRHA